MKWVCFPMKSDDGVLYELNEVLSIIPENNYEWRILFIEGRGDITSIFKGGWNELQALVVRPGGLVISWKDLNELAKNISQTYEIDIIALTKDYDLIAEEIEDRNYDNCEIMIESFDRNEWTLMAQDKLLLRKAREKFLPGKKMKKISFPVKSDNGDIKLQEVLNVIPENDYEWRILDIDGPSNISDVYESWDELNALIRPSGGLVISWEKLNRLAKNMVETWFCLIIALKKDYFSIADQIKDHNYDNCEIVIDVYDCYEWTLMAQNETIIEKARENFCQEEK